METRITDKLPPLDPGNIRIIVWLDGMEKQIFTDLPMSHLPKWLDELNDGAKALSRNPLAPGTEDGASAAREIFRKMIEMEAYPAACLPALWICLYAPAYLPGFGLCLDDLGAAAGAGTLRITVSRNYAEWHFHLESPLGDQGGHRTVPDWDSNVTMGTA
jgi:hypothetical protein